MGTLCMIIGAVALVACTGIGFLVSNTVASNSLYMSLLALKSVVPVYLVGVGACFAVGLLICLSLVMSGMIYNRVCKNGASVRKLTRTLRRSEVEDD